jgi:uncharacterized membrane protein YbhN (UPF0104 family)
LAEREMFQIDKRKATITAAVALVVAVAVIGGLGQVADYHKMAKALEASGKGWIAVGLLGEIAAYLGYVIAYRDVARADGGPCLSYWTATRVVMVGFGAFIAGSSAGTLGVDYWALHRAGDRPHQAARRVLALNTLEWGLLASFATIAAALTLAGWGNGAPLAMEVAWIVVVPSCVAAAIWVSSPRRADRLAALPKDRCRLTRDPRTWVRWLRDLARSGLADAIGGVVLVRHIVTRPRRHWHSVAGFVLYWAGDVFTLYTALRAFDVHAPIAPLVLAYTTAYVVTSLPLPAAGAGGVEAGLAFSLHAIGIPLAPALLATLVYRVYTLWVPLVVAAAFLPQVPKLATDLPLVEHAAN